MNTLDPKTSELFEVLSDFDKFDLKRILKLVDEGASMTARDEKSNTAFMSCLFYDDDVTFAIAKKMLEKGANIDEQNQDGMTALMLSTYSDKTTRLLFEKGANPAIKNNLGHDAFSHFFTEDRLFPHRFSTEIRSIYNAYATARAVKNCTISETPFKALKKVRIKSMVTP